MPSNSFSNFLVCCRRRLQSGKILVRCWTTSTGFFQQEEQWFPLGSLFVCDDEPNTLSRKFQGFGIWFFLSLYTKGHMWGWSVDRSRASPSRLAPFSPVWYYGTNAAVDLVVLDAFTPQSCLKKLHCIYLFGWVHTWRWESHQSDSDTMVLINEAHSTTIILVNMSSPAGGSQHLPLPGHHHHKVQEMRESRWWGFTCQTGVHPCLLHRHLVHCCCCEDKGRLQNIIRSAGRWLAAISWGLLCRQNSEAIVVDPNHPGTKL